MDFNLNDDRRMLRDSLTRLLADQAPVSRRNETAYTAPFHDPDVFQQIVELGVLAGFALETSGGFGGAGFDVTTIFECLGRALCTEPLLGPAMALAVLPADDPLVAPVMEGSVKIAVAHWETGEINTITVQNDHLSGRKSVVYGGNTADWFLVHAGGDDVFAVAADDAQILPFGMIDGGGACELILDQTPARRVEIDAGAWAQLVQTGIVALCAEAVGLIDALLEQTVEYLKTRTQFGRPIGAFQALQHCVVDLHIEAEQARSITMLAANSLHGADSQLHTAMAKNLIGRVGRLVAEETIQLHGGIAMTWEFPVSHYAKRLAMIDHQLGDSDMHLEHVAAQM
jgi:alkylation response protein AidB-like acyl-CoA dehydrogenase